MDDRRMYLHSAARMGTSAWPTARSEGLFVALDTTRAPSAHAADIVEQRPRTTGVVFAHSILGVSATLAAPALAPSALVLVEPALYDLVRGETSIERHIAAVTEARSLAAGGDLRGFWAILRPLMFGGPFEAARWDHERAVAEHWSAVPLPWGNGVRDRMLADTPKLVITGAWNAEYEAIARHLVTLGATHLALEGAQHRPQDLPGFVPAVEEFLSPLA